MSFVTKAQLVEALKDFDDNDQIEIAVKMYNKRYPIYLKIEKSPGWDVIAIKAPYGGIRLYSSMPQTEDTFTTISVRKK